VCGWLYLKVLKIVDFINSLIAVSTFSIASQAVLDEEISIFN